MGSSKKTSIIRSCSNRLSKRKLEVSPKDRPPYRPFEKDLSAEQKSSLLCDRGSKTCSSSANPSDLRSLICCARFESNINLELTGNLGRLASFRVVDKAREEDGLQLFCSNSKL